MKQISLLRVFLASPSDVSEERQLVRDVVAEVNATVGDQYRVRLEVVGWETHTFSSFGGEPQALIFKQLEMSDFDLFVGVMWNRFGTPTHAAGSGTEEEFETALELRERAGRPDLMFYFSRRLATLDGDALDQRKLVLQFKERIERQGLTKEYSDAGGFKETLRGDLLLWLADLSKNGKIPEISPGALLDSVVNSFELQHLRGLAQPKPFLVHYGEEFGNQLRHLRNLGFIKNLNDNRGVRSLPARGEFNLKEFFTITKRGRDLLLLREQSA
jgi:hypothetical protein